MASLSADAAAVVTGALSHALNSANDEASVEHQVTQAEAETRPVPSSPAATLAPLGGQQQCPQATTPKPTHNCQCKLVIMKLKA